MGAFEHITGTYALEKGVVKAVQGCASGDADEKTQDAILLKLKGSLKEIKNDLRARNIARTREDIKASVTPDIRIIQVVTNIEELDKVANRIAKRLRDWAALHDPELVHAHDDHKTFVDALIEQPRRADDTMGGDIGDDIGTLLAQAQLASQLYAQRDLLLEHLEAMMREHTQNLRHVAGAMIGAKLLAIAGSLKRLATMPAGTIQLLGAETALFRHLRNRNARPPKHGIIFNHPLLQRSQKRGRTARVLADCIAIAARVDYFKGDFNGEELLKKVEATV